MAITGRLILFMKKVAVIQSNYIPWKGYFDVINDVDLFIFHDDVQYTKDDWRNRNKIKTNQGLYWLTIPVGRNEHRLLCEVNISDHSWQKKHFNIIRQNYLKSPFFDKYEEFLYDFYCVKKWENLSRLNQYAIISISKLCGIKTEFMNSNDFHVNGVKHEKLLNLLNMVNADMYLSGFAANAYIVAEDYQKAGIELVWKDYTGYPEYLQMHKPFIHEISIIDLLMNTGPEAPWYIWGWRESSLEEWRNARQ